MPRQDMTYSPYQLAYFADELTLRGVADSIDVTTQTLNAEQLQAVSDDVGPNRNLLVCCSALRLSADAIGSRLPNLTVKKIPMVVLQKREWGHDDYYSLNVENWPASTTPSARTRVRKQVLPRFEPARVGGLSSDCSKRPTYRMKQPPCRFAATPRRGGQSLWAAGRH